MKKFNKSFKNSLKDLSKKYDLFKIPDDFWTHDDPSERGRKVTFHPSAKKLSTHIVLADGITFWFKR